MDKALKTSNCRKLEGTFVEEVQHEKWKKGKDICKVHKSHLVIESIKPKEIIEMSCNFTPRDTIE